MQPNRLKTEPLMHLNTEGIPMVLYASDFDQSRYLKAADLGEIGGEKRVKIKTVTKEIDVGERQETKACVWFTNIDKGLLLNKTITAGSARGLWRRYGALGRQNHSAYSIMAHFRGQMVPALRVRIPPPKEAYKAPASPPKQTPRCRLKKIVDGFDDPEQLDDDVSDVSMKA